VVPGDRNVGAPEEGSAPASRAEGVAEPSPTAPAADPHQGKAEQAKVEVDLKELVAGLERERDEYLELARRTKADFENYRKRVDREAALAEARGRAELARRLLPVLDNLERALAASETSNLAEGVRLVYEELSGVLRGAGIESYEPHGEAFDPELHEAMMTRPAGSGDAGKVLEVLEKGYRVNGQVLRPARVVVGAENQRVSDGAEE
jgi:molecular chaperone GrpE